MKALLPTLSIVSPILSCQILLWMARLCRVAALIGLMVLVSWGVPWKVEKKKCRLKWRRKIHFDPENCTIIILYIIWYLYIAYQVVDLRVSTTWEWAPESTRQAPAPIKHMVACSKGKAMESFFSDWTSLSYQVLDMPDVGSCQPVAFGHMLRLSACGPQGPSSKQCSLQAFELFMAWS